MDLTDLEAFISKTPATRDQIRARVSFAFERHPLCRDVEFEIIGMPRTRSGNWTVSMRSIRPDAVWEVSDIVADIQAAYDLTAAG